MIAMTSSLLYTNTNQQSRDAHMTWGAAVAGVANGYNASVSELLTEKRITNQFLAPTEPDRRPPIRKI